jgi:hypothetical protein
VQSGPIVISNAVGYDPVDPGYRGIRP